MRPFLFYSLTRYAPNRQLRPTLGSAARSTALFSSIIVLVVTACLAPPRQPTPLRDSAETSAEGFVLPAQDLPNRYFIGEAASADAISLWDIDVMPDGEGLPVGTGSVSEGSGIYARRCAQCHGKAGTEGPFDVLAGRAANDSFPFAEDPRIPKTIGNYWPWATTLFDYVRRSMPQDRPGSLADNEVYAVTAYLLHLNDLLGEEESLNQNSLPLIQMPARDRFEPDDRRGGKEIR